jgi:hypothetical protein
MKQAGLSYLYDYDTDGHAMVCNEKDIKRFAELIVAECANVAADHDALDIYEEIRQHFGVEE